MRQLCSAQCSVWDVRLTNSFSALLGVRSIQKLLKIAGPTLSGPGVLVWAPEGREGRIQLKVRAQRAPRLLVNNNCHIKFPMSTFCHIKLPSNTLYHIKLLINLTSKQTPRLSQSRSVLLWVTVIRLHFRASLIAKMKPFVHLFTHVYESYSFNSAIYDEGLCLIKLVINAVIFWPIWWSVGQFVTSGLKEIVKFLAKKIISYMNLKVSKVLGDQSYFLSSPKGGGIIGLGDGRFTVQTHVSLSFAIQNMAWYLSLFTLQLWFSSLHFPFPPRVWSNKI